MFELLIISTLLAALYCVLFLLIGEMGRHD